MKVILCVLFLALVDYALSKDFFVTLPESSGTLHAVADDNATVVVFKGVRYAQPPVGSRRWMPPQAYVPANNTSAVREATEFGNVCIQEASDTFESRMDEDCLFLNIDVSVDMLDHSALMKEGVPAPVPVPVVVFVHGGSYVRGAGLVYRGTDAIDFWKKQAIVVTFEYRLNVFGFLGAEELRVQDGASKSTGNYGLQDQRLALQWVQQNIAAFGGDPQRVTLMGESAGGGSVANHLSMKKSWGLYDSAIIESGSFSQWICHSMSKAQSSFDQMLMATDCRDVSCLLATDATALFQAAKSLPTYSSLALEDLPFSPTVDGVELLTHPWLALASGDIDDVPLLHGTNADEGLLFTSLSRDASADDLLTEWRDVQGYSPEEMRALEGLYGAQEYSHVPTVTHAWWQGQRSLGDKWFSCPAEYTSQQLTALNLSLPGRQSPTFMYHFEHPGHMSHYVVHGAEMAYVFHWSVVSASKKAYMADATCSYWGNFVLDANHDVNTQTVGLQGLSEWPPYADSGTAGRGGEGGGGGGRVQVLLDEGAITTQRGLKEDECEFFIQYIDAAIRKEFTN